jgi:hypothetical protein
VVRAHKTVLKPVVDVHKKAIQFAKDNPEIVAAAAIAVPGGAAAAPWIKAAMVARKIREQQKAVKMAEAEDRAIKQQRERLVSQLMRQGLDRSQAMRVIAMIESGVDPQKAVASVMPSRPTRPMPVRPMPVRPSGRKKVGTPRVGKEKGKVYFLGWLKQWKPDVYVAISRDYPEMMDSALTSHAASDLGYNDETMEYDLMEDDPGLGDLSALTDWVDKISSVSSKLLNTYYERKMLKIQLDRARQGLVPAPTAQVQQTAQQQVAVETGVPVSMVAAGGGVPWLPLAAAAGVGFFLLRR